MRNILCKLFRFLLDTFKQIVQVVAEAVTTLGNAVVDVLSELLESAGNAVGSIFGGKGVLGLALILGIGYFVLTGDDDEVQQ